MYAEGQKMPIMKKRGRTAAGSLMNISVDMIKSSPVQPRKYFSREGIDELAGSITRYGVLQPLTVRQRGGLYELVAGERRLRAAKQAGLSEVPCIVVKVNMEESGIIALVENLQRRDLDFIEEAEGIAQLIRLFGMSQEEAAKRLGKSQSAIANKLRILRLPEDVIENLRRAQLSERHGRALLRLPDAELQRMALEYIISEALNVAATEAYIERVLIEPEEKEDVAPEPEPVQEPYQEKISKRKTLFVLKDVRLFVNSITRSLDVMKRGGIEADMEKEETDAELIFKISIPKKKKSDT